MNTIGMDILSAFAERLPWLYLNIRQAKSTFEPGDTRTRQIGSWAGWRVAQGPFAGMKYPRIIARPDSASKLLGTYEQELNTIMSSLISASPACIVDVGAAEGYYAVGMARQLPSCKVVAFEMSGAQRGRLSILAKANNCTNVDVRGTCTSAELSNLMSNADVLIMDCEGGEFELLLVPDRSVFSNAVLIVELHGFAVARSDDEIVQHFCPTHDCTIISGSVRSQSDLPDGWIFGDAVALQAMDEGRFVDGKHTHAGWLIMWPKSRERLNVGQ